MQVNGMTRNNSPVYFFYPPDPSGRRPSERTLLQYANPAERAADQGRGGDQQYQQNISPRLNSTSQPRLSQQNQHSALDLTPTSSRRHAGESYENSGNAGGNSSLSRSNNSGHHSRTEPQRIEYWRCCQPGCGQVGRYISRIHVTCIAGCRRPRCLQCSSETEISRDYPPPW